MKISKLCRRRKGGDKFCSVSNYVDQKLQQYLTTLRGNGGIVSAWVAMAAANGLLLALNRGALAEYGGHIKITRHWACSLFHRMKFVQRKVTTLQSKYIATNFAEVKQKFLDDVVETVEMEEVCPELILNWDQTGIQVVPSSTWTMEREGVSCIEMVGAKDKRQITAAVFCCTLQGDSFLYNSFTKERQVDATQNFSFHQDGILRMHRNTGLLSRP